MLKSDKKIRVLHILNSLGYGGTEIWLLEILKQNDGNLEIEFLLTSGKKNELDDQFLNFGANIHYVEFSYLGVFGFAKNFNKILKNGNFDVIHNHEDFVAGWHWLLTIKNWPKKRIAHSHNSNIYIQNYCCNRRRKLFYKIGKFLSGIFSTHITGTSDLVLNQLGYNGFPYKTKRIEPLYCGTHTRKFEFNPKKRSKIRFELGINESEFVVLFIGRIDCPRPNDINHKNPLFALEIAEKITDFNDKLKFLFVGDKGDLGKKIEEDIEKVNKSKKICLLGKRNDIPDLMSAADIFLFTSLVEPFGLVLIEAQYNSLKIIASNVITNEVIENDSLFQLLDIGDSKNWVGAIQTEVEKRVMSPRVFSDKIENSKFSIEESFNRLLRIYNS